MLSVTLYWDTGQSWEANCWRSTRIEEMLGRRSGAWAERRLGAEKQITVIEFEKRKQNPPDPKVEKWIGLADAEPWYQGWRSSKMPLCERPGCWRQWGWWRVRSRRAASPPCVGRRWAADWGRGGHLKVNVVVGIKDSWLFNTLFGNNLDAQLQQGMKKGEKIHLVSPLFPEWTRINLHRQKKASDRSASGNNIGQHNRRRGRNGSRFYWQNFSS